MLSESARMTTAKEAAFRVLYNEQYSKELPKMCVNPLLATKVANPKEYSLASLIE